MATSFHRFRKLPAELRLMVYGHALKEEQSGRRVIMWDGRIMPYKNLASPLLRVNYETRKCALAFYTIKVDIYSIPSPMDAPALRTHGGGRAGYLASFKGTYEFPTAAGPVDQDFVRMRLIFRQTTAASNICETVNLQNVWNQSAMRHLTEKATEVLQSLQLHSTRSGTMYLSPTHDKILYGYSCSPDFFQNSRTDILQGCGGGGEDTEFGVWRHFSGKLPASVDFQNSNIGEIADVYRAKLGRNIMSEIRRNIVVQPDPALSTGQKARIHSTQLADMDKYGTIPGVLPEKVVAPGARVPLQLVAVTTIQHAQHPTEHTHVDIEINF